MTKFTVVRAPVAKMLSGDLSGVSALDAADQAGVAAGICKGRVTLKAVAGEAIRRYGPADVAISTWSNTGYWPAQALPWFEANCTRRLRLALRRGIGGLQPALCAAVQARWGAGAILEVESHVEVALLDGDGWSLVATGSGCLEETGILEWWRVDRRPEVAAFWREWFDGLPAWSAVDAPANGQRSLAEVVGSW